MLAVSHIYKKFVKNEKKMKRMKKTEFYAVEDVSFQVKEGEILGILGPNGAGKTTLLRIAGLLMEPTKGEIFLDFSQKDGICKKEFSENGNSSVKKRDKTQMKRYLGYLSGNTKLYGRFSIREILQVLGEIYGMTKEEIGQRTDKIIEVLKLENFVDNRIEKLSTGQTQRANIARCLLHDPQVYIFDEPTLGLDIISSASIIDFMKQEKENGKSVIYSTHYMEEAEFLCDRILMMLKGKIIAEGTPVELKEQTGTTNLRDCFMKLMKEEGKGDGELADKEDYFTV